MWDGLREKLPALRLLSPAVATRLGFPFLSRDDEQALAERILALPTRASALDKSDVHVDADVVVSDTVLPCRYPEASPGYIAANQPLTEFGHLLLDREVVAVDSKTALVGIFILDVRRQVTSLGGEATPRDGPNSGCSGDRRRIPLSVDHVRTRVVPRLGHLPATACRCVL